MGEREDAWRVQSRVQDLAKRVARLVGGGRKSVYQCLRREGGVWFVSRSTPDSGSGARFQRRTGWWSQPVPRCKLVKSTERAAAAACQGHGAGAGTWSFSCFWGSIMDAVVLTVRRRIWCEPRPDVASEPPGGVEGGGQHGSDESRVTCRLSARRCDGCTILHYRSYLPVTLCAGCLQHQASPAICCLFRG